MSEYGVTVARKTRTDTAGDTDYENKSVAYSAGANITGFVTGQRQRRDHEPQGQRSSRTCRLILKGDQTTAIDDHYSYDSVDYDVTEINQVRVDGTVVFQRLNLIEAKST